MLKRHASLQLAGAALAVAVLALAACSDGGGSVRGPGCQPSGNPVAVPDNNLFANGSFEEGEDPWFSLATEAWGMPFSASEAAANGGTSSAYLRLDSAEGGQNRVFGVVQEIAPEQFPGTLTGYYCVDSWVKGTPKQYLQFVVIALDSDNIPEEVAFATNHQIRYILTGVENQPTDITNSKYVFFERGEPRLGQWVRFERDVRRDFQELWGSAPEGYESIRVLFEVRWDERLTTDDESSADIYYDDLSWTP